MAVNYVQSTQVVSHNGFNLAQLNFQTGVVSGSTVNIPTAQNGAFIVGAFWRIPVTQNGSSVKYTYTPAYDATKPQADALKVLRVKWERETWDIAIADADYVGTTNEFGTLADGLGGTLATMTVVIIPFPIIQQDPQAIDTTSGDRTFVFSFPLNPLALGYSIPWPWFNGIAGVPAYSPLTESPPSTITTAAQFVTWANTNWGDYGTWDSDGNIVTLVNADSDTIVVTKAGLMPQLTPKAWCLNLTAFSIPAAVNGMKLGSGATIPFGAFMLTDLNMQTLINAVRPHFEDGAVLTVSGSHKINILSVSDTLKIYNNASLIATATAGAC